MLKKLVFALLFGVACLTGAYANDASWEMDPAGGLVLLQQQNIAMVSEELYISLHKIEVNYVFENRSNVDIKTIVGFPFPYYENNFVDDFKIWVEGRLVETDYYDRQDEQAVEAWEQLFPAGLKLHIRHVYTPVPGGDPYGVITEPEEDHFCMTDDAKRAYKSMKEAATQPDRLYPTGINFNVVKYILTTGGYWADGTIGDFHLVVDKGTDDDIVAFCADGMKQTGSQRYEWHKKQFHPDKDLEIMFIGPSSGIKQRLESK